MLKNKHEKQNDKDRHTEKQVANFQLKHPHHHTRLSDAMSPTSLLLSSRLTGMLGLALLSCDFAKISSPPARSSLKSDYIKLAMQKIANLPNQNVTYQVSLSNPSPSVLIQEICLCSIATTSAGPFLEVRLGDPSIL